MQVEGQTNPSNGRLTTSLIAPIAVNPSTEVAASTIPKFVFLGSQQHGNGNVKYHVGVAVPHDTTRTFNDLRTFDELRDVALSPLANGLIDVSHNTHLHVHGLAHGKDGRPLAFHLIIENMPDGHITANIAAVNSDDTVGHYSGFLSHGSGSAGAHVVPLKGISLNSVNSFSLHNLDGQEIQFDVYVDDLVVEAGLLNRIGANYKVQRDGDSVKIMPLDGSPEDPYGNQPITTIQAFDPLTRIRIDVPPVVLHHESISGNIAPLRAAPNSFGGISDR